MPRDFFAPPLDETNILNVSAATLRRAEALIIGCEACSEDAEFPFDTVLDRITGQDPAVTDYVLSEPAKCPRCRGSVVEKTLIECAPGDSDP